MRQLRQAVADAAGELVRAEVEGEANRGATGIPGGLEDAGGAADGRAGASGRGAAGRCPQARTGVAAGVAAGAELRRGLGRRGRPDLGLRGAWLPALRRARARAALPSATCKSQQRSPARLRPRLSATRPSRRILGAKAGRGRRSPRSPRPLPPSRSRRPRPCPSGPACRPNPRRRCRDPGRNYRRSSRP